MNEAGRKFIFGSYPIPHILILLEMKKSVLYAITAIIYLMLPAWAFPQVAQTTVEIGKNYITGKEITAQRFDFPGTIDKIHISGRDNVVMTACGGIREKGREHRNSGEVNVISFDNDSVIFRMEYNDAAYFIDFSDQLMFRRSRKAPTAEYMNPYADMVYFKGKGVPVLNGLFEDKYLNLSSKALTLHDIGGNKIWKAKVDFENGVKEFIVEEKDSSLLICTGGVRKVSLADGKGWKFDEHTEVNEKGAAWKAILAGVMSGVVSVRAGSTVNMNYRPAYYANVCSNINIHEGWVYWAAMSRMVCLDYDSGNVVWEVPLNRRKMGSSEIVIRDNRMWLINRGCVGPNGDVYREKGSPSVMVFDLNSGEMKHSVDLDDIPVHYMVDEEGLELYFTGGKGIYRFSLDEMEMKTVFNYDGSEWDTPLFMRRDLFFDPEDSGEFKWIYQSMPQSVMPVIKNLEEVVFADMVEGEQTGTCRLDDVYYTAGEFNNYTILSGGKGAKVMNISQQAVSEFDCVKRRMFRKGDYLLWCEDRHLYRLALADLIPDYTVGMEGEIFQDDFIL